MVFLYPDVSFWWCLSQVIPVILKYPQPLPSGFPTSWDRAPNWKPSGPSPPPICGKNAFRFLNFFGIFRETNIILKFLGSLRVEGCFFRWLDILFDFFFGNIWLGRILPQFPCIFRQGGSRCFPGKMVEAAKMAENDWACAFFRVFWYSLKRTATKNPKTYRPLSTKMGKKKQHLHWSAWSAHCFMYDSVLVSGRVEAAICLVCWNPGGDASFPTKVEEKSIHQKKKFHFLDGGGEKATPSQVLVPLKGTALKGNMQEKWRYIFGIWAIYKDYIRYKFINASISRKLRNMFPDVPRKKNLLLYFNRGPYNGLS